MFFLTHITVHNISIIITIIKITFFTTFKLKINSYRVLLSLMILQKVSRYFIKRVTVLTSSVFKPVDSSSRRCWRCLCFSHKHSHTHSLHSLCYRLLPSTTCDIITLLQIQLSISSRDQGYMERGVSLKNSNSKLGSKAPLTLVMTFVVDIIIDYLHVIMLQMTLESFLQRKNKYFL